MKKIIDYIPLFLKKTKKDYSKTTAQSRSRHLNFFSDWLKENEFEDLTPEMISSKLIKKYTLSLKKKKSTRTKKPISRNTFENYLRSLKYFLIFLEERTNAPSPEELGLEENTETDVQKLVNYYFETKGISIEKLKRETKKKNIIYSRHTKPAKDLLSLAGSLKEAQKALKKVSEWAKSRNLNYAIETVFKKWPELENLKPKKKEKKPFYKGDRMIKSRGKWHVIDKEGQWFEFAGDKDDIEWREVD